METEGMADPRRSTMERGFWIAAESELNKEPARRTKYTLIRLYKKYLEQKDHLDFQEKLFTIQQPCLGYL